MNFMEIMPIPAIVGLCELAKKLGLKAKYSPVVALIFGLLIAFGEMFKGSWNIDYYQFIMTGIVYGLTASGLYSGTKAVTNDFRKK
jgi:hypothetical protein